MAAASGHRRTVSETDAETAEKLLPDWDWLESPTDDQALPLLVALDDERFVSQLLKARSSTDCSSMFWRSVWIVGRKRWRGIVWTLH